MDIETDELADALAGASSANNWTRYEDQFLRAKKARPEYGPVYYALSMVAYERKDFVEGLKRIEQALKHCKGSDRITSQILKAIILKELGQLEKAETAFETAQGFASNSGFLEEYGEAIFPSLRNIRESLISQGRQGSIKSILRSEILQGIQVSECTHALGLVKSFEFTIRPGIIAYLAHRMGTRERLNSRLSHKNTPLIFVSHLLRMPFIITMFIMSKAIRLAFRSKFRAIMTIVATAILAVYLFSLISRDLTSCQSLSGVRSCDLVAAITGVRSLQLMHGLETVIFSLVGLVIFYLLSKAIYLFMLGRSVCYDFRDGAIIVKHGVVWADVMLIEMIFTSGYTIERTVLERLFGKAELRFIVKDSGVGSTQNHTVTLLGKGGHSGVEKLMLDIRGINRVLHSVNRIKGLVA